MSMAHEHFGLKSDPFTLTPDTRFYCESHSHEEAMQTIIYAIEEGQSFCLVHGEVGVGKTLLCRRLLDRLTQMGIDFCFVFNPNMPITEFKKTILTELGVKNIEQDGYFEAINQKLIDNAQQGKETVLVIDEGQTQTDEGLEFVRSLTNLEMTSRKLIQIVMFAQPELVERLKSDHLKQLAQRFSYVCQLKCLHESQVERYIAGRLVAAGHEHGHILTRKAIGYLWRHTQGNPRLMNTLIKKAMLSAYAEDRCNIGARDIEVAAQESKLALRQREVIETQDHRHKLWTMMGYGMLAALVLIVLGMVELNI